MSSWRRRKQCCTAQLLLKAMKVHVAWMASFDKLVKNRDAKSYSSFNKPLSSANMILIAYQELQKETWMLMRDWMEGPGIERVLKRAEWFEPQ